MNSQTHTHIARWAETGGSGTTSVNPSPTSIRNDTRFPEGNQIKSRRCLKISDTSTDIYDIIKPALARLLLAVPRLGRTALSPNHSIHDRTLRMPKHSIPKTETNYNNFFISTQFFCKFTLSSIVFRLTRMCELLRIY